MKPGTVLLVLWGLSAVPALAQPASGASSQAAEVPVLWRAPSCDHEKLGGVAIKEGTEVSSRTKEAWVPPANYRVAFHRLGEAAQARGANAVVLRMHEATFFTQGKTRSRRPVLVQLKGAAIRIPAPDCALDIVDPQLVLDRALRGEPFDVPSELTVPSAS